MSQMLRCGPRCPLQWRSRREEERYLQPRTAAGSLPGGVDPGTAAAAAAVVRSGGPREGARRRGRGARGQGAALPVALPSAAVWVGRGGGTPAPRIHTQHFRGPDQGHA